MSDSARERRGPCAGVRVLDFSTVVSGPVCTQHLGDLGANVVKVEPPIGDFSRLAGGEPRGGLNGFFAQNNRNKRSVVLDLKTEAGVEVARDLAARSDVVVENYRPGVADRIGIGFEQLRSRNPRLVYVAISGFGPDGPYAELPAYDPILQALTGFMPVQGDGPEAPRMIQCVAADKVAGLHAVSAVLAALLEREHSGQGQRVDVPMLDAYAAFILPEQMGPRTFVDAAPQPAPPSMFRHFQTRDGFVVGVASQDDQYVGLCRALDREDLENDERFCHIAARFQNLEAFYALIEAEIRKWDTAEFVERARRFGAPFAPVLDVDGFAADPQVRHNGTLMEQSVDGVGTLRSLRPALRFERSSVDTHQPPPRLGAHTDEVLAELGYTPDRLRTLREAGAIR